MDILKADCRICKKKTNHKKMDEFENLPAYVVALMCQGCGVMGIVLLEDAKEVDCE